MGDDKNKEIIIHKEVTSFSQFQCPILKSTNYTVWALRIKTILRANGLWELIEPEDNAQIDIKKDMATTAYLYQALPEDMILQVASCKSVKEIWEALQTRHIGVDRVQKARLQTLKTEFEMLKMKEDIIVMSLDIMQETVQNQTFDKSKRKERAREREIKEKERERELAKEKEREGGRDERGTDNLIQGIKLTNDSGNRSREEK
ncbi:zinc finger, CCHC-type containing protein [Tanacetum coccineum]